MSWNMIEKNKTLYNRCGKNTQFSNCLVLNLPYLTTV